MYSKILILHFPPSVTQEPIVYYLTKKFDLSFNILHARVSIEKAGYMVLEISGTKDNFNKGIKFLKNHDVKITNAEHEISRDDEKCTHCGACTAICPTEALSIKRPEMEVIYDKGKCSVCEQCILGCPTRIMKLSSKNTEKIFK